MVTIKMNEEKEKEPNKFEEIITNTTDQYCAIFDKLRLDSCKSIYQVVRLELQKLDAVFQMTKKLEPQEDYFVYWDKYIKELEEKLDFQIRIIESMKKNIKLFDEYDKLRMY